MSGSGIARAAAVAACLGSAACLGGSGHGDPPGPSSAPSADDGLSPLRAFEAERRRATDFAALPTSDTFAGPDPYALRALPGDAGYVGILRGRDAVVVLDPSLREVQRLPAPASPSALAVSATEVFVAGETSASVARYRIRADRLEPIAAVELARVRALRDLALGPEGVLYAVEEHDDRLITVDVGAGKGHTPRPRADQKICGGPFRVRRAGAHVLVDCLFDHVIVVRGVDPAGYPLATDEARLANDGPFWSFDAMTAGDGLLVAAGGVEDHPLDRTQGSFGFIDSFVYLFRIAGGAVTKVASVNVSSLGVITPKAIVLEGATDGATAVTVTGYGGDKMAVLSWSRDLGAPPATSVRDLPPGTSSVTPRPAGGLALANPLLDVWATTSSSEPWTPSAIPDPSGRPRSSESRLGEALFFTSRMAPWNKSEGQLSRFTCETCHFEGYVDGRTHHTGRGDIHATTKPLLGLFNNRPHFSRALDPDLTTVAHAEFRVAGALSDHDPWFTLDPAAEAPWVKELGVAGPVAPLDLRRALMTFLMEFTHRPNPAVVGRTTWTAEERAGAEVFRDKCEGCHSARLASDDPATAVPFDRWEALVMSPAGPIVWGKAEYKKTGIEPYVHAEGARVPSLRRLYKKRPYFTNGSAKNLGDVLATARELPGGAFLHSGGTDMLDGRTRLALLAFLDLL